MGSEKYGEDEIYVYIYITRYYTQTARLHGSDTGDRQHKEPHLEPGGQAPITTEEDNALTGPAEVASQRSWSKLKAALSREAEAESAGATTDHRARRTEERS